MSSGPRQTRASKEGATADEPRRARKTAPNGTRRAPVDGADETRPRAHVEDEVAHSNGRDGSSAVDVPLLAGVPLVRPEEISPEEIMRHTRARRRTLLLAGTLMLVLVLIIESIVLSPWTDPVAGQPPRQPSTVPLAEVDPYGVNVFLHKEVDEWKKEKTLDMAVDMGAGWIKQQFPWDEIEFSKGNYYDAKNNQSSWTKFDDIVDLAQQRGLRIIARIDSTPDWAKLDDNMPEAQKANQRAAKYYTKFPPSPGHMADFDRFISTFVQHYKGRIAALQIWNEPNLVGEWGTGIDAQAYTDLLKNAYIFAKAVDPNIVILAAPLATTITDPGKIVDGNLNEMDFLQAMYYAGARPYFDVMSANAYGKALPPEDPPDPNKLNFRRVELLRQVMDRNGDRNKAIWFNEYGWNASPDNLPTPTAQGQATYPWDRVTPEQQADYTVRGIQYARDHWPWAGLFTIWYLRQVGDIQPTTSEYYFGLVSPDGFVPSPAYVAVQSAAKEASQLAGPGEWGPLSAPVKAGASWNIHLSPAAPGGSYVVPTSATIENNDAISFTFQGTGVTLKLVPPTEPITGTATVTARYYVSVDGGSRDVDSSLPRDAQGRAYIDLPGSGQATSVKVVNDIGRELPTGKHTLSITVRSIAAGNAKAGSAQLATPGSGVEPLNLPGIAAIDIEVNRSYILFTILTLLLLAGIALELVALRRNSLSAQVGGARAR